MDKLSQEEVFRQLIESTSAVPWRLDWQTKQFTYVGSQLSQLLGWPPSHWKDVGDWQACIHPDERSYVVDFCIQQSLSGLDHEAEYRARANNGTYVWVRDVVHVVRDEGRVDALLGFIIRGHDRERQHSVSVTSRRGQEMSIASLLQNTFGFTHAETLVADALIAGQCARDYAAQRQISINTVRSQIRALLEKVGVKRQSDLILTLINMQPTSDTSRLNIRMDHG